MKPHVNKVSEKKNIYIEKEDIVRIHTRYRPVRHNKCGWQKIRHIKKK